MNAAARPYPARMTADEFIAWALSRDARCELLDGTVVAMAPERALHARTKISAYQALDAAILRAGSRCEAFVDGMAVPVDATTVFEPDAMLRCGPPLPDDAVKVPDPLLVVEVLSPSTRSIDTGTKLLAYFRLPSVRHYLVLEPESRTLVHHARDAAGAIATRILRDGTLVLDPPGLTIDIASLFPAPR